MTRWILRRMNAMLFVLVATFILAIGVGVWAAYTDASASIWMLAVTVIALVWSVTVVGSAVAHIGHRVEQLERDSHVE